MTLTDRPISRRQYFATLLDLVVRIAGLSIIIFYLVARLHASNKAPEFPALLFWIILVSAWLLVHLGSIFTAIGRSRDQGGFVQTLWLNDLKRMHMPPKIRESKRATGKMKTFTAWFLPGFFGPLAVSLSLIFPMAIHSANRNPPAKAGEIFLAFIVPFSLFVLPVAYLVFHCYRQAKDQGITLTESLYEWNYRQLESKNRQTAKPAQFPPQRTSTRRGLLYLAAGILISLAMRFKATGTYSREMLTIFVFMLTFSFLVKLLNWLKFGEVVPRPDTLEETSPQSRMR